MKIGKLPLWLIFVVSIDLSLATNPTTIQEKRDLQQFQDVDFFNKVLDFLAIGDGTTISIQNVSDEEEDDDDVAADQVPDLESLNEENEHLLSIADKIDKHLVVESIDINQIDNNEDLNQKDLQVQPIQEKIGNEELNNQDLTSSGNDSSNFSSTSADEKPLLQFGAGIYFEKKIKKVEEEDDCGEEEETKKKKKWKKLIPFSIDDAPYGNDTTTLNSRKFQIDSSYLVSQALNDSHNLFKSNLYENDFAAEATAITFNHSSPSLNSGHYHQEKHEYIPAFPNSAQFNNSVGRRKIIRKKIRKSLNGTTIFKKNNNTVGLVGGSSLINNDSSIDGIIQIQESNNGNYLTISSTSLITISVSFIVYLLY